MSMITHRASLPLALRALAWRPTLAVAFALLVCASGAALAAPGVRGEGGLDQGDPRVVGELLVDATAVRPGDRVQVGVLFTMDPDWHIYWRHPGDSGGATELSWRSASAEIGATRWPAPRVYLEAGVLTTFGYEGEVLLASPATVAADASGRWRIEVDAEFVVCKIECIPGEFELAREVPIAPTAAPPDDATRFLFQRAASRLPRSGEELGLSLVVRTSQGAVRPGDRFLMALDVSSCGDDAPACIPWTLAATRAHDAFVPDRSRALQLTPRGVGVPPSGGPGDFSVMLAGRAFEEARLDEERLRGIVPVVREGQTAHLEFDLPIARAAPDGELEVAPASAFEVLDPLAAPPEPHGADSARAADPGGSLSLGAAVLLALLGGLILNLMPCVLPVLALKVFGIAELAHAERGRVVQNGLAYLVGVLASMMVLASVVVGLRAAGTTVGWGFQFQEPVFLAAIATLLVVFAMNLFGAFEVTWQPSGLAAAAGPASHSPARSFFEGTLAVVLATPCTAPFLGTAVGFAFAGSGTVIFAIFAAIGLGLAAPYVLVTLVPGWARFVPRPGAWMLRVRAVLGFSLLAAVVWLLWIAGRAVGPDAQAILLAYLVAVAFGFWILGALQATARFAAARALAVALLGLVALSLAGLPLAPQAREDAAALAQAGQGGGIDWLRWEPAAIARERAAGRPVFVDFTADWCITCKVNETVVLADDAVRAELARWDFATFKADWTLRDEAIGRELAAYGRAGVPMVLAYPADSAREPSLLPELLTVDGTIEALREVASSEGVATRRGTEWTRGASEVPSPGMAGRTGGMR